MSEIVKLFIKSCPVFYFYKDEPYMPCNFDDLLKIANVSVNDLNNIKLINLPREKRFNHPIATQILCKTEGYITVSDRTYIDLVYIVTFSWNGTAQEHAFDKEEVIVRLEKNNNNEYEIIRIFGSCHGNGMWWHRDSMNVDHDTKKIIVYPANESHAIYNEPRVHKRIFGFGNDVCGQDIRWEPTEFVIFMTQPNDSLNTSVNIYDINEKLIRANVDYFKYPHNIGDYKNNQEWPGPLIYETLDMDSYYKYQGGFDNLFTGKHKVVYYKYRYIARIITGIILFLFLGYLINYNVIKSPIVGKIKNTGLILLQILIFALIFVASAYISWEIFIISPISNIDIITEPIKLKLYDEDNDHIHEST
jgi:hypothetical protein